MRFCRPEDFTRYLQEEETLSASEKEIGGKSIVCYQRARGYCGERTAWIQHDLANDFYVVGCREQNPDLQRQYLKSALKYVDGALASYPPEGFTDPTQAIPTEELKRKLTNKPCS